MAKGQTDCKDDINYSISNVTLNAGNAGYLSSDDQSIQITIGQSYMGASGSKNQGISERAGFWGYYLLEPQAPIVNASQGEFLDRIEVSWEVVDDLKGPVVTEQLTQIFRNGRLLTTVPLKQTSYVDFNVFPGEFYTYEIVTSNDLGDARPIQAMGFLNPNGRITGKVQSRLGAPVADVQVTLTPNLGRSLNLNGTSAYAYFVDQELTIGEYYTVEGWWRNVAVKDQTMFVAVDSGTSTPVVKISLDANGKVHYYHDGNADGTGVELVSKNGYNLDQFSRDWHHFAAVYDTADVFLYVDGQRVAQGVKEKPIARPVELEFGKNGPKNYSGYFSGYLDEFRLWKVGRKRTEIRKYKGITLTGEETYLRSYWKFDEQISEKLFDFADNPVSQRQEGYICGIDRSDFISPAKLGAYTDEGGDYIIKGIYYGNGTTFAATPSKKSSIGSSLKFDGTNDFVSFELDRITLKNALTLEGWFKTGVSGKDMVIFESTNETGDQTLFQIGLNASGQFVASSGFGGSLNTFTSTDAYNDEFWYHYAIAHDGSTATIYIDGKSVGSVIDGPMDSIRTRTVIGRSNPVAYATGSNYFEGLLDEIRLWDYARTETQINATMNQIIPGNEKGIVDADGKLGLSAYWMISEGRGALITDATPHNHTGNLMNYQTVKVSATDSIVTNWNGDDIPLDVEFFTHDFDPNARNVSLDPSVVSVDRVDFTDISSLGVSGFIRYAGTNCFADSVEILVNGASTLPATFTGKDGQFTVEFEPGSTGQILSYKLADHTFDPGYIELPTINKPLTGMAVKDTKARKFTGRIVGGECHIPLGGTSQVVISTSPYCYSDTVSVDTNGNFIFENIPPLKYVASVIHSDPNVQAYFDQKGAENIDLSKGSSSFDFIYRAPLNVEITGLDANGCSAPVVAQNDFVEVTFQTYEMYGATRCIVQAGTYIVNDNISDRDQESIDFDTTQLVYQIKGGQPNILSGGTHPYQKNIQIVAKDTLGRQATFDVWAYVTGNRPRSVDFATTAPEMPFIILRDPPGDQSSAYLEKGTTIGSSFSMSYESSVGAGGTIEAKLGQSLKTEAGSPFFSVGTEIKSEFTMTNSFSASQTLSSDSESSFEFTSSDMFSTEETSDVYVGGALNLLYGTTDVLSIDNQCQVSVTQEVIFAPNGFNTTFIYSEDHITGTIIPELKAIGDTASANTWQGFVDYNNSLKKAAKFVENISFDAGTSFERTVTTTQSQTATFNTEISLDRTFAVAAGFSINDNGLTSEVSASVSINYGSSRTISKTSETTVGFSLADDDFGDNYTVNIKQDPVYATPVFDVISAASSCPGLWGLKREGVKLTSDKNQAINVPEDQPAVFKLNLGNISETNESGTYLLTLLSESNPNGAVAKVNGVPLSGDQHISFTLQPNEQLEATMTVEKGPNAFDYSGLQMMLYSECEKDWADARGYNIPLAPFASIVSLDVNFIEVCSPITIYDPGDDWVITQANNNTMSVTLTDYVLDRTDFTTVKLQYREKIEGQPWINAIEMARANLDPGTTVLNWDVTNLDDGIYELRAVSFCDAIPNPRSSEVLTGTIDRKAPGMLGTASPTDQVLGPDDVISIEFDENIQCADIISLGIPVSLKQGEANNVALSNTETGLFIASKVTCEGNKLLIVPDIQNKYIEGQVIRVDVLGMTDELGNQQTEAITWEFLVQRNQLAWQGGDIQSVTYEGQSPKFVRQVKNNGAFAVNVNLSGALDVQTLDETALPSWITASPRSFSLQPGATQDVTFMISDQISGGQYTDVVTAATSFGAPKLNFDIRVLCQEPDWSVMASDFEYSTTITGELIIRGDTSRDEYDMVAAFVGDDLRGVGNVTYAPELAAVPGENPYLVFMTVYSNSTADENITFQVWDASRCQLYGQVAETYHIGAKSVSIGSPTNPASITVTNNVVESISLNKGWNWVSFNLNAESSATNDLLSTMQNTSRGDVIKSQSAYSQYVPGLGWVGPLGKIDSTKSYRMKLTNPDVLKVSGIPVDFETTKIKLDSGWNWISFLPPIGMDINEALSSLNATADFIIKGQKDFAQYVDFQGWIGSLDFMKPNQGYLIFSNKAQTLTYPVNNSNARIEVPEETNIQLPEGWSLEPSAYEFNSNYIIKVEGTEVKEGDVLGLFTGNTLVGIGEAKYLDFQDAFYFFVTAYSNGNNQVLTPVIARDKDQITFEGQALAYQADQVYGTVKDPLVLRTSKVLGAKLPKLSFDIYPNPGTTTTTLQLNLVETGEVHITIQNLMGQTLQKQSLGKLPTGQHEVSLSREVNGQKLSSGIYFVRIETGGKVYTEKLVWK